MPNFAEVGETWDKKTCVLLIKPLHFVHKTLMIKCGSNELPDSGSFGFLAPQSHGTYMIEQWSEFRLGMSYSHRTNT